MKGDLQICETCGKEFIVKYPNQRFCSNQCSAKSKSKKVNCTCDCCGKKFMRKLSEVKDKEYHYCSTECYFTAKGWPDEDNAILIEHYKDMSIDEIQKILSKEYSRGAIVSEAARLGLQTYSHWNQEEVNILIENYSNIPMDELQTLLPSKNRGSIITKAGTLKLSSYATLNRAYTDEENEFLRENYLKMSVAELAQGVGRAEAATAAHMRSIGLYRSKDLERDNSRSLNKYVRCRLDPWRDKIVRDCNHTCQLTRKKGNVNIHHIYGFSLIFQDTCEKLNFQIRDSLDEYTEDELQLFVNTFLDIQDSHNAYICILEEIHVLFHREYGYGDNTPEQWNEFVEKFKNHYYDNIA